MPTKDDSKFSRRTFLERLFTASVVTMAAPSVLLSQNTPRLSLGKTGVSGAYTININDAFPLLEIDGAVEFLLSEIAFGFRIIVTRISENEFVAVNSQCPHQGFRVKPKGTGILECTAHQSRFTPDGTYISGPANGQNMKRYPTSFDGDSTVTVEIDELASVAEEAGNASGIHIHSSGPIAGQITFAVSLAKPADLTLSIWSLDGREVMRPFQGYKEAGTHYLSGDFSTLEKGIYLYRLTSPNQVIGSGKLTAGL